MPSILSGGIAVGARGAGMWYFKPRHGVVHPLVTKPFFDTFIVVVLVGFFAIGVSR